MEISRWVSVLIIVVLLVGTAVPLLRLYSKDGSSQNGGISGGSGNDGAVAASLALPDFATRNAKTIKAYEVASTTRKEDFAFLACHCGCGMHAMEHRGKTIPKMHNLRDCFIREDGTWEDHAAMDCPYCVDLAVMADDLLSKGYTLKQVRDVIDAKYNQLPANMRAMDMNPPMPQ